MRTLKIHSAIKILWMVLILPLVHIPESIAQDSYKINSDSKVMIQGTSSIHDWESESDKVLGKAKIQLENGQLSAIDQVEVRIPVNSIQSGKSGMDKKTYDALEAKDHPYITFNQSAIKSIEPEKIVITGDLNIAGISRKVELEASFSVKGSEIIFTGSLPLKMNEFEIDPPTALMGTIKTGNDIILEYTGVFSKSN